MPFTDSPSDRLTALTLIPIAPYRGCETLFRNRRAISGALQLSSFRGSFLCMNTKRFGSAVIVIPPSKLACENTGVEIGCPAVDRSRSTISSKRRKSGLIIPGSTPFATRTTANSTRITSVRGPPAPTFASCCMVFYTNGQRPRSVAAVLSFPIASITVPEAPSLPSRARFSSATSRAGRSVPRITAGFCVQGRCAVRCLFISHPSPGWSSLGTVRDLAPEPRHSFRMITAAWRTASSGRRRGQAGRPDRARAKHPCIEDRPPGRGLIARVRPGAPRRGSP